MGDAVVVGLFAHGVVSVVRTAMPTAPTDRLLFAVSSVSCVLAAAFVSGSVTRGVLLSVAGLGASQLIGAVSALVTVTADKSLAELLRGVRRSRG